jgi:hypothetical protein
MSLSKLRSIQKFSLINNLYSTQRCIDLKLSNHQQLRHQVTSVNLNQNNNDNNNKKEFYSSNSIKILTLFGFLGIFI